MTTTPFFEADETTEEYGVDAAQIAAARVMLSALEQIQERLAGSDFDKPTWDDLNTVAAAIKQAREAGL